MMTAYVLEGHIMYGGHITLGVYTSRAAASMAAEQFERNNRAESYPTDYDYRINAIELDAPAGEHMYAESMVEQ